MTHTLITSKISFEPSQKHLVDIENWLLEEWRQTSSGFYLNWDIITKAFAENELGVIIQNDYAIGFVVYRIDLYEADIDIISIKPSERKKGVAKKLIEGTLLHFKSRGVLVAGLFCMPEDSQRFFKKIGFELSPKLPDDSRLNMFKPLVETLQPSEVDESGQSIHLWDCEPHEIHRTPVKWIWNLIFEEDSKVLVKPIIFPASGDWYIALMNKGEKMISEKVKRIGIDQTGYPGFIIIREI